MAEIDRPSCKIVLLGNSGVGKTSLVNRWMTNSFNPNGKPTIGANHQRKSVKIQNQDVDLFIWDTAGQEQFQALTPLYAREAASAFITVSITDIDSFKSLDTWIDLLKSSCAVIPPMLLAVNKIDLIDQAVYTHEEIENQFGDTFSGIFYVSASTGEGVAQAFMHAAQTGYEHLCQTTRTTTTTTQKIDGSSSSTKEGCC